MILPTIHLNGTGPKMLKEGYLLAYRAVKDAEAALIAVEFNGRDYYPQGDAAWKQARVEHGERLKQLHTIADDLMQICEHASDALDARERQNQRDFLGDQRPILTALDLLESDLRPSPENSPETAPTKGALPPGSRKR